MRVLHRPRPLFYAYIVSIPSRLSLSLCLSLSLSHTHTLSPVDYANYYAHSVDEIEKVQKSNFKNGANCGHSSTGKKCKKAFFL